MPSPRTAFALPIFHRGAVAALLTLAAVVSPAPLRAQSDNDRATLYGPNINPSDPYSPLPDMFSTPGARRDNNPWGPFGSSPDFDQSRSSGSRPAHNTATGPVLHAIYFPPLPPRLGAVFPKEPPVAAASVGPALDRYVGEFFYPALAGRAKRNELKPRQLEDLARYEARKSALLEALRTRLDSLRSTPRSERSQSLAEFARTQSTELSALETEAERLRVSLASSEHAWSARRRWHLGDSAKPEYTPAEIARVMRAAAFFQDGLGLEQRRLLIEIAQEKGAAAAPESAARAVPLFFTPAMGRAYLPVELPAGVAEKIAAFAAQKTALKDELYRAVYREDATASDSTRTSRLKALSAQQEPALRALEALADDIRLGLAALPSPYRRTTPASTLPLELQGRIATLLTTQMQVRADVVTRIEQARKKYPGYQVPYQFTAEGLKYAIRLQPGAKTAPRKHEGLSPQVELEMEMSRLATAYRAGLTIIEGEQDQVRRAIGTALSSDDNAAIGAAFAAAVTIAIEQQHAPTTALYATALFEPGLSPAQRRLLLDNAFVDFGLRLPLPEIQPEDRPGTAR